MDNLHTFKIYTAVKVALSYLCEFAIDAYNSVKRVFADNDASRIEQLYPSQQGTYVFHKTDPDTLISSNKILIDQTATILMFDERSFDKSIMPIIEYLAKYCLKLPASNYYHHVQPGSLFYHLLETANLAAEGAKSHPELMMHTDAGTRADYEIIFPLGAWLLGILHDIAKPMTDMEIIPLNKIGQPITAASWQPDEETLFDFLVAHKACRYKMLYRETREYHQHDAYRVWFISKLLSFFPKESGMREQLKHIIPVHAASRHPLNFIVKQADRVSTKRDTQRFRPPPSVSNLAKAFVDVLQDYDTVKRFDDVVSLPYYFSNWAIHIPFPEGVRVMINQVNTRYAAYTDIPLPSDPDSWANLLGAEHSLLIANQRASDYRSLKYPDINRYVYFVVLNPGTDREERVRVISLSLEHVSLVKPVGARLLDVAFESQHNTHPDNVVEHRTPTNDTPESTPTTKTKPKTKAAKKTKPKAKKPPKSDNAGEPQNATSAAPSAELPLPQESKQAPAEQKHATPVPAQVKSQVKATIAPPDNRTQPPLSINLEALASLDITSQQSTQTSTPAADEKNNEKANRQPSLIDIKTLQDDSVTPVVIEHDNDPELAIRQYLQQVPQSHVLFALFNDDVLVFNDEIKLYLWALSLDLSQHETSTLFSNKHKQYQVLPDGVAVLKSHLDNVLKTVSVFDPAVAEHVQKTVSKLVTAAKCEVYQRVFSTHKKRGYRFLNNDIACAVMLNKGEQLRNYFTTVEEESVCER